MSVVRDEQQVITVRTECSRPDPRDLLENHFQVLTPSFTKSVPDVYDHFDTVPCNGFCILDSPLVQE